MLKRKKRDCSKYQMTSYEWRKGSLVEGVRGVRRDGQRTTVLFLIFYFL